QVHGVHRSTGSTGPLSRRSRKMSAVLTARRFEVANQSCGCLNRPDCETLQSDRVGDGEIAAIVSIAQAVVGFRQRSASDSEKPGELRVAESSEPFCDVARHGGR